MRCARLAPASTQLHEPLPNPFNPATLLRFDLARAGRAAVRLYDARGRWVADVMTEQHLEPGSHEARWTGIDHRGRAVASGVYFARLTLDERAVGPVRRLVLLK